MGFAVGFGRPLVVFRVSIVLRVVLYRVLNWCYSISLGFCTFIDRVARPEEPVEQLTNASQPGLPVVPFCHVLGLVSLLKPSLGRTRASLVSVSVEGLYRVLRFERL